jgi:mono/diheme cytochrome c family protein
VKGEAMHKIGSVAVLAVMGGLFLTAAGANAQSAGDAMRGASLAESWCVACHVVDNKGTGRTVDLAPPFPRIANDPQKTRGFLQQWLVSSHPQMPNFQLGRREIDDLIAYIQTLKSKP